MDSPNTNEKAIRKCSLRGPLLVGCLSTPLVTFISLGVVSNLVPCREEGIRTVVNLPWTIYAVLCILSPLPFICLISYCVFRNTRQRIMSVLVSVVVFIPCALTALGIASRIFIGKF